MATQLAPGKIDQNPCHVWQVHKETQGLQPILWHRTVGAWAFKQEGSKTNGAQNAQQFPPTIQQYTSQVTCKGYIEKTINRTHHLACAALIVLMYRFFKSTSFSTALRSASAAFTSRCCSGICLSLRSENRTHTGCSTLRLPSLPCTSERRDSRADTCPGSACQRSSPSSNLSFHQDWVGITQVTS